MISPERCPAKSAPSGRGAPGLPLYCSFRGFTLIEIIAVLFIVSLLLGLVVPSLSLLTGHKVQSDAKRLAGIVRYINDSALGTKKIFSLTVDLDQKKLRYEIPEGTRSEQCDTLSGVEIHSKGLITAGEVTLFFGPLGGREHIVFHLDDSGKNPSTIAFNPLSGRVRISDETRK